MSDEIDGSLVHGENEFGTVDLGEEHAGLDDGDAHATFDGVHAHSDQADAHVLTGTAEIYHGDGEGYGFHGQLGGVTGETDHFSAGGLTGTADAYVDHEGQSALALTGNWGEVNARTSDKGDAHRDDDYFGHLGVSAGGGMGLRVYHGTDVDHDGHKEYGFGFDLAFVSMDTRAEDGFIDHPNEAAAHMRQDFHDYAGQQWDAASQQAVQWGQATENAWQDAAASATRDYGVDPQTLQQAHDWGAQQAQDAYNAAQWGATATGQAYDWASQQVDAAPQQAIQTAAWAAEEVHQAAQYANHVPEAVVESAVTTAEKVEQAVEHEVTSTVETVEHGIETVAESGSQLLADTKSTLGDAWDKITS